MRGIAALIVLLASTAQAAQTASFRPGKAQEPLYFAVEVRQDGRLLAHPKLLGLAGKPLRVERRQPGSLEPDYQFSLMPRRQGNHYQVGLDLVLPDRQAHSETALIHGEVRRLELGNRPGELQVSLTVMRVNSPEFRALMRLPQLESSNRSI